MERAEGLQTRSTVISAIYGRTLLPAVLIAKSEKWIEVQVCFFERVPPKSHSGNDIMCDNASACSVSAYFVLEKQVDQTKIKTFSVLFRKVVERKATSNGDTACEVLSFIVGV